MSFRNAVKDWIPPAVMSQLTRVQIARLTMRNRAILRCNKRFLGVCEDKDVYIIGNGPSLSGIDLQALEGKPLFVCNDFYLHNDTANLNLQYYFNLDPRELWYEKIQQYMDKKQLSNMNFFFPIRSQGQAARLFRPNIENTYFIGHHGSIYESYGKYLDLSRTTLKIINILQVMLLMANYMRFKNAYLLGFDLNFLAYKTKADVKHFYDSRDVSQVPAVQPNQYGRVAFNTYQLFNALRALRDEVTMNIYNSNPESYLDMFEYRGLE